MAALTIECRERLSPQKTKQLYICRNIFTNSSTLLSKHTRGGKSENVKENFNFKLEPILLQKYIGFIKFHYIEYREAIASKK